MKKLSIFLWLMVFIFVSYIVYSLLQQTSCKSQDLEAISQQNVALQTIKKIIQQKVDERIEFLIKLSSKQGGRREEEKIMQLEITDSVTYRIDYQLDSLFFIQQNLPNQLVSNQISVLFNTYSQSISSQTIDFKPVFRPTMTYTSLLQPVFHQQYLNCLQGDLWRSTERLAEQLSAYLTTVTIQFPSNYRVVSAKNIFHSGEFYEANILTINDIVDDKRIKMYINDHRIRQSPYSIGQITVRIDDNKIIQNKLQLVGKVLLKRNRFTDTIFTVTATYTIKPKKQK